MSTRATARQSTRRRIAEAALELFKARDFDDVSLNEIARAAGVSHQTVLNHFESKAGVLPACAEVFSEQVAARNSDVATGDPLSVESTADGYVHEKWAVFVDGEGNVIRIDGSLNESKTALSINCTMPGACQTRALQLCKGNFTTLSMDNMPTRGDMTMVRGPASVVVRCA